MKKRIIFLLVVITLFSCSEQTKSTDAQNGKSTAKNLDFKLDNFNSIPDTIDGCGEYFKLENENENSEKFIFLSTLTSFAIIKVDGKNVFLEKDSINSKNISKDEYLKIYIGKQFKAILKVKLIEHYDEGGFYQGTLKISNKKSEIEYKIKGESGC